MPSIPNLHGFIGASGKPIVVDMQSPSFVAAVRPKQEPEPKHKGFLVTGYPPGYVAEAQKAAKTAEQLWDEVAWMKKNKPKRVAKPYSIPAAADDCAALATRAGWTHIRVEAMTTANK